MKRDHGVFASPVFPRQKDNGRSASADEKSDHPRVAPGIVVTTIFECKKDHYSCRGEKDKADQVKGFEEGREDIDGAAFLALFGNPCEY
jgi:hypothetical protein